MQTTRRQIVSNATPFIARDSRRKLNETTEIMHKSTPCVKYRK